MNPHSAERLEWEYAQQAIANGRARFIRRELVGQLVMFVALMIGLYALDALHREARNTFFAVAILLPVWILGGYLQAIWKWKDILRKVGS